MLYIVSVLPQSPRFSNLNHILFLIARVCILFPKHFSSALPPCYLPIKKLSKENIRKWLAGKKN